MKIFNHKTGVSLTLQTVIVAVLVLIVLIVLIAIFMRSSGGLVGTITSCEDRDGQCYSDSKSCIASGGSVYRLGRCPGDNQVCCVPDQTHAREEYDY